MSNDLCWLSATEMARRYRDGSLSPVEVVDAVLDRLEETEPALNAFVTITADTAREQARQAEHDLRKNGDLPPLHGIPVSVKDLDDTAGVQTTYGCKAFAGYVPEKDAEGWARLKAAGAILIGKTTTPDFGMLGVTNSSLTGFTNNPWNTKLTAGGSSGGAAASVAAGVGPIAWGSDGGGSIRVPASVCGVVGLKCSPWRIPVETEHSAFEHGTAVGPLTRTAEDNALALAVTAGPTLRAPLAPPPLDQTALAAAMADPSVKGLRIGYSPNLGYGIVEAEVESVVRAAADVFEQTLGAQVELVEISIPDPIDFFLHYWCPGMAAAEETFKQMEPRVDISSLNESMAAYIAEGKKVSTVELYQTIHQTQTQIVFGYADVLERCDLIICPTTPVAAFPHEEGGGPAKVDGKDFGPWPDLQFHRLTESPSHAGLPCLSVPCGFTTDGRPVGLQIIGRPLNDIGILAAAAAYQAATSWKDQVPSLA